MGVLDEAMSQVADLKHRMGLMEHVKQGLAGLVKKGTSLTEDDVVNEASKLVAAGLKPDAMAALLSQMPEKPQELQDWVAKYAGMAEQRELQLESQMKEARHTAGVAGVMKLAGLLNGQGASPQGAEEGSALSPMPQAPGQEGAAPNEAAGSAPSGGNSLMGI